METLTERDVEIADTRSVMPIPRERSNREHLMDAFWLLVSVPAFLLVIHILAWLSNGTGVCGW